MFILYSLQAHTGNSGIKALLRHGGGGGGRGLSERCYDVLEEKWASDSCV